MPEFNKFLGQQEPAVGNLIIRFFFGLLAGAFTWLVLISGIFLFIPLFWLVQKLSFYLIGNDDATLAVILFYFVFIGFCGVRAATLMTPNYTWRISSWLFTLFSLTVYSALDINFILPLERHLPGTPPPGLFNDPFFYCLLVGGIVSSFHLTFFSKKLSS